MEIALPFDSFRFKMLRNGALSDMSVNGSITPVAFSFQIEANRTFRLQRSLVRIVDRSIRPDLFGGIAALTNGITIELQDADSNVLLDFMDGKTVQDNSDFSHLAGVDSQVDPASVPSNDDAYLVRWTLEKAGAAFKMTNRQKLVFTINDDLTELTHFETVIQGVYV